MRHNDGLQYDEGGCSSLRPRSPIHGLSNYPGCLATPPKASPPGPAGQQLGTPSIVCCPAFWTPRPHQGWTQPLQGPAWYQWMGGASCLKKQFRCLKPICLCAAGKAAQVSDRKPLLPKRSCPKVGGLGSALLGEVKKGRWAWLSPRVLRESHPFSFLDVLLHLDSLRQ